MANFQNNAITDSGRALLSHVQMGAVFTPTKIVVGSGYMPPGKTARTMTDVVTPVKNLTINKKQRTNDGKAIFGGVYSNQDISQDWYFRELALYAKAVYPEGQEIAECLYSYGNAGDQADLMPAYTTGQPVERQMDLVVYVGNDAKVDLTIESGVYLTQEQAEKMIAEALADIDLDITDDTTGLKYRWGIQSGNAYLKESETEDKKLLVVMASQVGKPNGVAGLDGSGKVPAGQLPKMDYDPAGSAEAVQQALTAHTGNKNNPHAVTVEQVGALASSGGVMSGALSMSGHKIANLAAPAAPTDAANKQYVDEHTGAKVVTGSYVGTGKTGKNNPTEISLPKPFKVLCIYGMQYPDSYYDIYPTDSTGTGQTCNIISGSSIPTEYTRYFGFFYSSKPSDSYGKKSADGKTFSWYYDLTPSSAASVQLNKSGTIYHYYAIL